MKISIELSEKDKEEARLWRLRKCGSIDFKELKTAFGFYYEKQKEAEKCHH